MTRIAEAQRKAGRLVGGDAERAWREARAAADESFSDEAVEETLLFPLREGRDAPAEAGLPLITGRDSRPPLSKRERAVPSLPEEYSALARRLFEPAPIGAAAKNILFCGGRDEPRSVARLVAERLAASYTSARVAIVTMGQRSEPDAVFVGDSAVEVFSMNAGDAQRRAPEMTALFDFVLFDAQLTIGDPDLLALARSVDGVVLLVAENATRREAAKAMVEMLQRSSAKLLGAVLTDRTYPIPQRIYERL